MSFKIGVSDAAISWNKLSVVELKSSAFIPYLLEFSNLFLADFSYKNVQYEIGF